MAFTAILNNLNNLSDILDDAIEAWGEAIESGSWRASEAAARAHGTALHAYEEAMAAANVSDREAHDAARPLPTRGGR